jgi:hypothetical protein
MKKLTKSEYEVWLDGYNTAILEQSNNVKIKHDNTIQNSGYLAGYREALRYVITMLNEAMKHNTDE